MADESAVADDWLYGTLAADSLLQSLIGDRLYPDMAPPKTSPPYAVYSVLGGTDTNTAGQSRAYTRLLYQVKVIGRGGQTELRPVIDRIDALLHGQNGSAAGAGIKCVRTGGVRRTAQMVSDTRYDSRMALYQVTVQPDTQ